MVFQNYAGRERNKLKPIYIFQSGTLSRKGNTLAFKNESDEKTKYFPIENISEIKIFGEININKRLLEFLSANNLPIHFFNHYGFYVGSFYPYEHNTNGITIVKQVEHYISSEKRLVLAKKFVEGAMQNILKIVQYYERKGNLTIKRHSQKMEEFIQNIPQIGSINELMAQEGNYREIYYNFIDNNIISNEDFKMVVREKRPPTNYLNTLISFGNSLMYSTVLTQIYQTPLDPRIGYLHSSNFKKFSLNLDIAEIFKPIVVDRTIFNLVNKKIINENHFKKVQGGIHLNEEGQKNFIKNYEEHLSTTLKHKKLKRNITYRTLIKHEAYKILKHLIEEKEYVPFTMRW